MSSSTVSGLTTSFFAWKKSFNNYAASGTYLLNRAIGNTEVGPSTGALKITDTRTKREYTIPISHNAVKATDFRQITAAGKGADPVDQVESGLRIFDRGYHNTACIESNITLIDGKIGYIQYRDYPIEYLFENHDYEDCMHLLILGHLPSPAEKSTFRRSLATAQANVPKTVYDVIHAFPRETQPYTMLMAGISAFAAHDEGTHATHTDGRPQFIGNMQKTDAALIRCLAVLSTSIAIVYCHKRGKEFTPADPNGSYIGNQLLMMGFTKDDKPDPKIEKCLERLWILYADHEMTNSTAAFLHAASTLTDPLSCMMSALVSAYGPLHGGAIDLAYKGFEQVGCPENVPLLIADVKAKKQRLFGYGHRVYKAVDPRTKFIRQLIADHDEEVSSNPLLKIALEIDRVAGEDGYFTSRNLKANADLYGCFLYTAFGFETDIITPLAALSRLTGVMAHWREAMGQSPALYRPMQIFTGQIAEGFTA